MIREMVQNDWKQAAEIYLQGIEKGFYSTFSKYCKYCNA